MLDSTGEAEACTALAVGAHPDDIEMQMAGTLLLLKKAGADIHMWNIANGSCGTVVLDKEEITRLRWEETQDSAREAGATIHPPLVDDITIFYEPVLLARIAAVIRQVKPNILLVPSLEDYMEDHQNTCRLLVTAAFVRGMRNFDTSPPTAPWNGHTALYHAMPYGLRKVVQAEYYVDVGCVLDRKLAMLAKHRTQKEWLDVSQGLDAYLTATRELCRTVGRMSNRFEFAEGWRRHSNVGFGPDGHDPLKDMLLDACWVDPEYEKSLR